MTVTAYGFATQEIPEAEYAAMESTLMPGSVLSGLSVAVTGAARSVSVAAGKARHGGGVLWTSTAAAVVTLAENTSGLPRIDTIVAQSDWTASPGSEGSLTVVSGQPAASPVAPALTRNAGAKWQVPLADVLVANGAGVLSAGDVTDRRYQQSPLVVAASTVTRPPAPDRAVVVESDTGAVFASNGSAYARVLPRILYGSKRWALAVGQEADYSLVVVFPTPFEGVPVMAFNSGDSRVHIATSQVSSTQFTGNARWMENDPDDPTSAVTGTFTWIAIGV